jgi:diadenylate cyclase
LASLINSIAASVLDEVQHYWASIRFFSRPTAILDIIIVAMIFYWLYLLIRQTRAIRILYGIVFLFILWLLGRALDLTTLNYLLSYAVTAIIVAIPVVFQPELRAALEKLGRTEIVSELSHLRHQPENIIDILVETVEILAHRKIGSIIVIARKTGLREYIDTGLRLDARLSPELLLSIFAPQSALHDGAVIIQNNRIVAAKAILPLSDNKFDYHLGTRHRAGVGLTAHSDALAIIVSEERGEISLAINGLLETGIALDTLKRNLSQNLNPNSKKHKNE